MSKSSKNAKEVSSEAHVCNACGEPGLTWHKTTGMVRLGRDGVIHTCNHAQLAAFKQTNVGRGRKTISKTPDYRIWACMRQRCYDSARDSWKYYGGRGIKVCDRWRDSFFAFLEDMGPRPPGMSLERKDVNGDYGPDNCVWATKSEQQLNRRDNRVLEFSGERLSISVWARRLGIPRGSIRYRIKAGWPIEKILTLPSQRQAERNRAEEEK